MGNKRHVVSAAALLVVLVCGMFTRALALDTKVSMVLWNRYTAEMKDGEVEENSFALERGYLRLEPKFNDKIKGRFNLDFFSSDKAADANGAGVKLKYAYLDFKPLIAVQPDFKISAGLIKNYFGMIYDYDYTIIQKALEDKEGVCASTDYGIAVANYLPMGYGEYAVAVYNGEGYKKAGGNVDTRPKYAVNARVIPYPGITVGGSFAYQADQYPGAVIAETTATDTTYEEIANMQAAAVGRFVFGMVDVWGEFVTTMGAHDSIATAAGFSVMPIIRTSKVLPVPVDLVGRYDQWDPDTDTDDDGHTRITAGFNWIIERDAKGGPAVQAQVNWERKIPEASGSDPTDYLMVQLAWKFSSLIAEN